MQLLEGLPLARRDGIEKSMLWGLIGGLIYYAMEGVWRIRSNGGWAHISMAVVGGICFLLVGSINQRPEFYHLSMRKQAALGMGMVLAVEFLAGCVLNLWLGLGIWDYSQMPFNVLGQVCLLFGALWFLLMPLAIWLEDRLNLMYACYLVGAGEEYRGAGLYDYSLAAAYGELFWGERR